VRGILNMKISYVNQMRINARKIIEDKYSWDVKINELIEVIE
jgi:hypothetical protein